jgi:hypothetical protein
MSIKKYFYRICLSIALFCALVLASACQVTWPPQEKALLVRCVFDPSRDSGVSPMTATNLIDALLPGVIGRRGVLEFYRLDDVEGASLLGRFVTGQPLRESRSAIAAFERDRLAEAKRSFALLRDTIFSSPPRSSPLALSLTVLSMNVPKDTEVRYFLASDAREYSQGVDFECHPPTIDTWSEILQRDGLLPAGSLKGTTTTFVGVRPLMPTPGNRCPASLSLMNQTRSLWVSTITNAGGKVAFSSDSNDPSFPLSLATLLFYSGGVLAWRKMRVRRRAKRDSNENRYAFQSILMDLIGPKPGLDPDHPEHQQLQNRRAHLEPLTDQLRAQLKTIRERLTEHVRWIYYAFGCNLCALAEMSAWVFMFQQAGMPSPERYLLGSMTGLFVLIAIGFAVKHAQETGRRGWFYATIAILGIIVIAATMVRVANAMATGGELYEELAFAILIAVGVVGPGLALEYLLQPLKAVLPLVRMRREVKKQFREASRELLAVTKKLAHHANLRRAWEWEREVLKGVYDGYNPPPNNPAPQGPNPNGPNPNAPFNQATRRGA